MPVSTVRLAVPPTTGSRRPGPAAALVGSILGTLSAGAARLRRSGKPLHPRGASFTGTLVRTGADPAWGVPWLDDTGEAPVTVRLSRSAGLPTGLPDVNGVAIRVRDDAAGGDLLLSNTGTGRLGRFVLVPHVRVGGVHTSLLPFSTAAGPLLLRADLSEAGPGSRSARSVDRVRLPVTLDLSAARPRGPWRPFGRVTLTAPVGPEADPPLSFDPIGNALPGLPSYPWAAALRGRSYAAARAVRAAS